MRNDSTEAGEVRRGRVCALGLLMSKKCSSCLGFSFLPLLKEGVGEREPALTEIQLRETPRCAFVLLSNSQVT